MNLIMVPNKSRQQELEEKLSVEKNILSVWKNFFDDDKIAKSKERITNIEEQLKNIANDREKQILKHTHKGYEQSQKCSHCGRHHSWYDKDECRENRQDINKYNIKK